MELLRSQDYDPVQRRFVAAERSDERGVGGDWT